MKPKRLLAVRHADGRMERYCPKCNQVMTYHDGGYSEQFIQGEYSQVEIPSMWECESCGLVIDEDEDHELALAFGAV